ncbi:hypothetical protein TELCIR_09698, partial [Teladorsagia circumcincta]
MQASQSNKRKPLRLGGGAKGPSPLQKGEEHDSCDNVPKVGSANQTNDGRYNFVATITLIQDGGKNILVDTGLGTDINGRMQLMN